MGKMKYVSNSLQLEQYGKIGWLTKILRSIHNRKTGYIKIGIPLQNDWNTEG